MPSSTPETNSDRLFHRLSFDDRQERIIHDGIPWKHYYWPFPNETAGARPVKIYWNRELNDGTRLSDYELLLEDFKLVIWSAFTESGGVNRKSGGLNSLNLAMYSLSNFMIEYGLTRLYELTPDTIENYLDWIAYDITDGDPDIEISDSQIDHRLSIISTIVVQSRLLSSLGHAFPTEELLSFNAKNKVKLLGKKLTGTIPAIPDELAIRLINEAYSVIRTHTSDTTFLLHDFLERKLAAMKRFANVGHATGSFSKIYDGYIFQISELTGEPWHTPLKKSAKAGCQISDIIRQMVERLRDACLLIIQASTGIRVSELCGLEVEPDWDGAYPSCIKLVAAESGLYDLFYLKGKVYKLRGQPEECEWLIGVRPLDTDSTPFIVEAIAVLELLYRPMRELCHSKSLVMIIVNRSGLPTSAKSLSTISSDVVRAGLKRFAKENINWEEIPQLSSQGISIKEYIDSKGNILKTHQWRKNFGQFLYRVDHTMTPTISRHFKHTNLIMTEQNYIGSDYRLLDDINTIQRREHARFLYEYCTGNRVVDGLGSKLIEEFKPHFKIDPGDPEASMVRIEKICVERSLMSTIGPHGRCLIGFSPLSAECHKAAGTTSWANKFPNYEAQTPSMCTGCSCFVVDAMHLQFWKDRYEKNNDAWLIAKSGREEPHFSIAHQRASQAQKIVQRLEKKIHG